MAAEGQIINDRNRAKISARAGVDGQVGTHPRGIGNRGSGIHAELAGSVRIAVCRERHGKQIGKVIRIHKHDIARDNEVAGIALVRADVPADIGRAVDIVVVRNAAVHSACRAPRVPLFIKHLRANDTGVDVGAVRNKLNHAVVIHRSVRLNQSFVIDNRVEGVV